MNNRALLMVLLVISVVLVGVVVGICILLPRRDASFSTRNKLYHLHVAMILYRKEKGAWPDMMEWKEQIDPYVYRKSGARSKSDCYIDRWGNEIQYLAVEVKGETKRRLYSLGCNGLDEKGTGDDIVFDIDESPDVNRSLKTE